MVQDVAQATPRELFPRHGGATNVLLKVVSFRIGRISVRNSVRPLKGLLGAFLKSTPEDRLLDSRIHDTSRTASVTQGQ